MVLLTTRRLAFCSIILTEAVLAAPLNEDNIHPRSSGIQWGPCDASFERAKALGGYNGTINCANLTVPLDYAYKTSNATVQLNILQVPVPTGSSKGTVQLNFGGPGLEGRLALAESIATYQALTGFAYDLLAFDPRGTGNTLPYSCYNATERAGLGTFQTNVNASDTATGEIWAAAGTLASGCALRLKYAPYVGTAATARDYMSVVDALGQDDLLHYYGGSYGTILGATLAGMFPDRIGHMVLDGVLDANEYYHDSAEAEYITRSDETLSGFFAGCVAAPDNCAIAGGNKTAAQLEAEFYDFLYDVKYLPLSDGFSSLFRYADIKAVLRNTLYAPSGWANFSVALKAVYEGNLTQASLALSGGFNPGAGIATTPEANFGIRGADKTVRSKSLTGFMPSIEKILETSQSIGDVSVFVQAAVTQWLTPAVEVYGGDFKVKTKKPVLLVSNTFDPVAPLEAAERLNGLLEGSSLLINNGYGHTLLSQASACAIKHIVAYFLSCALPAPNTVCQPDVPLFSTNVTVANVFALALADS